jgi:(p)ppGpp synthase/HD superfamily hydrolase
MFSPRVERALRAALAAHEGQVRKGLEPAPYVTHPIQIALLLARLGFDDVLVQAGLLHDVVEDCPGWTLSRIEDEFGADVAAIVGELTEDKSKSWEERKRWAVDHAPHMSAGALAVKAADKLHNLESLVRELENATDRSAVWKKFKGGRERTLATSAALVEALAPRVDERLGAALRAAMHELARLGASD